MSQSKKAHEAADQEKWELIRRDPLYRRYWKRFVALQSMTGQAVHRPRKRNNMAVADWLRWAEIETGLRPKTTSLSAYWGYKWSLRNMVDPDQPFTKEVKFLKPQRRFPCQLYVSEEIFEYIDEHELADGSTTQRVSDRYAIVVVDMNEGIDEQIKALQRKLLDQQGALEEAGRIRPYPRLSAKSSAKLRHLRVLDMLNQVPRPKNPEIAREIEGDDDDWDYLTRRGGKMVFYARQALSKCRNPRKLVRYPRRIIIS